LPCCSYANRTYTLSEKWYPTGLGPCIWGFSCYGGIDYPLGNYYCQTDDSNPPVESPPEEFRCTDPEKTEFGFLASMELTDYPMLGQVLIEVTINITWDTQDKPLGADEYYVHQMVFRKFVDKPLDCDNLDETLDFWSESGSLGCDRSGAVVRVYSA
jgi:hypothetical protein